MKIEKGMFVRTKDGLIRKITNLLKYPSGATVYEVDLDFVSDEPEYHWSFIEEDIIKASYNITDLIEEGDYIRLISNAYFNPVYYSYGELVICHDIPISKYSNDFIAEVLTKEIINKESYKIERI